MSPGDLLDVDLFRLMIIAATPLLVAALGELIIERSGVLNLSIAGTVALGASATFVVTHKVGDSVGGVLAGLAAALAVGALMGLLLAYFSVTLRAPQVTVGLGLFVFAVGAASMLYRAVIGVSTESVRVQTLPEVAIPGLSRLPFVGDVLFRHNLFVYGAFLLAIPVGWFLFRTPIGLRLRGVGENPKSLDSLGVPVFRMRYLAVIAGSALIGLAGAFFPLSLTGGFDAGSATARGWLALMLVIFGRWRPMQILIGALLFAYVDALQFKFAVTVKAIPPQFLLMLPYVLAIIVLVRVYGRAEAPSALTKPYDREARV
jgi:ABC-type uncharacterized transport system permease subunit